MKKLTLKFSLITAVAASFGMLAVSAQADQVINDDIIVNGGDGSACIGVNCVEGMVFGFSTVVIDNPDGSILFTDTSGSANFSTTDWRLGTESSSGNFYIENEDTNTQVLTVGSDGNAVALGGNATLVDGAVTVGDLRVANVADGVDDTDAVTLGQLNTVIYDAGFEGDLSANAAQLSANAEQLSENARQLVVLEQNINDIGAIGSALSALQVNPRGAGDHFFSAGFGYYNGSTALALGSFHFLNNDRIFVNTGIAGTTDGQSSIAARAGITFGR